MTDATGPTPLPTAVTASGRGGSIYDLGYRRYEGPRLGRPSAVRALTIDSFRTAYGIGHGGRAKVAPIVLGALAILPAVVVLGVLTLATRLGAREQLEAATPIGYDTYYRSIDAIIALFCAAQAPELLSRDQRHGVLALYFARALRRSDYAVARIGGFALALLLLLLLPVTILFLGRVLLATDVVTAIADDLPKLPAVLGQALVITGLFGSVAMAVSAFTPRRAYATAGIIALFVLPGVIANAVIAQGSGALGIILVLLSPGTILDGTSALFFGTGLPETLFFFDLPIWTFLLSAILVTLVAVLVTIRRFQRITT
jgi:ABC-2 type transport system permease protein